MRLDAGARRRLFSSRRSPVQQLAETLDWLSGAGASFVSLAQLLALSDEGGGGSPKILLAADTDLKGLRSDIVPLVRSKGLPLCLMLATTTTASSVLDLERSLERGAQPLRFETALRGDRSFEDGKLPAERVYAQLLSLRRERERLLQRPCQAYFAAGRSVGAGAEDLLQRCGFALLFGRGPKRVGGLWPSQNLREFQPKKWLA